MRKFPIYKYPVKLNFGCGPHQEKGFINIDIRDMGQEMIWDMRDGIPFPDNSVDEVYLSHTLEHVTDDEALAFIVDALRVLKKDKLLVVVVPHINTGTAIYFGHKSYWNQDKIEALYRSETSMAKFLIEENREFEGQLFFKLRKL